MTKGTYSMGKKSGKRTCLKCRRCGKIAYHKIKRVCSSCGYGKTTKIRSYNWQKSDKKSKK